MKIIFVISLSLLVVSVSAKARAFYKACPRSPDKCFYPYVWDPVCSTNSCTYANKGEMKCAKAHFWYKGECKSPYNASG